MLTLYMPPDINPADIANILTRLTKPALCHTGGEVLLIIYLGVTVYQSVGYIR
jgi:hypothetical protein